eukprot:6177041-Lingulodinium_polyedra.AAC.1
MESKAAKAFFSDTPRFGMRSSGALESHETRQGPCAMCRCEPKWLRSKACVVQHYHMNTTSGS